MVKNDFASLTGLVVLQHLDRQVEFLRRVQIRLNDAHVFIVSLLSSLDEEEEEVEEEEDEEATMLSFFFFFFSTNLLRPTAKAVAVCCCSNVFCENDDNNDDDDDDVDDTTKEEKMMIKKKKKKKKTVPPTSSLSSLSSSFSSSSSVFLCPSSLCFDIFYGRCKIAFFLLFFRFGFLVETRDWVEPAFFNASQGTLTRRKHHHRLRPSPPRITRIPTSEERLDDDKDEDVLLS